MVISRNDIKRRRKDSDTTVDTLPESPKRYLIVNDLFYLLLYICYVLEQRFMLRGNLHKGLT